MSEVEALKAENARLASENARLRRRGIQEMRTQLEAAAESIIASEFPSDRCCAEMEAAQREDRGKLVQSCVSGYTLDDTQWIFGGEISRNLIDGPKLKAAVRRLLRRELTNDELKTALLESEDDREEFRQFCEFGGSKSVLEKQCRAWPRWPMDDALVAELEMMARDAAQRSLRTWLPMMFGTEELQELCTAYGVAATVEGEELETLFERLTDPFISAHLLQLYRPPGNLIPRLLEGDVSDRDRRRRWVSKMDMYWRGALSLHKMKVPMLQSMLKKRPYLQEHRTEDVQNEGDDDDAHTNDSGPTNEELEAAIDPQRTEQPGQTQEALQKEHPVDVMIEPRLKLRMIQVLLPEYTMVAETPEYQAKRQQEAVDRKKNLEAEASTIRKHLESSQQDEREVAYKKIVELAAIRSEQPSTGSIWSELDDRRQKIMLLKMCIAIIGETVLVAPADDADDVKDTLIELILTAESQRLQLAAGQDDATQREMQLQAFHAELTTLELSALQKRAKEAVAADNTDRPGSSRLRHLKRHSVHHSMDNMMTMNQAAAAVGVENSRRDRARQLKRRARTSIDLSVDITEMSRAIAALDAENAVTSPHKSPSENGAMQQKQTGVRIGHIEFQRAAQVLYEGVSADPLSLSCGAYAGLAAALDSDDNVIGVALKKRVNEIERQDAIVIACLQSFVPMFFSFGPGNCCKAASIAESTWLGWQMTATHKVFANELGGRLQQLTALWAELLSKPKQSDLDDLITSGAWQCIHDCITRKPAVAKALLEWHSSVDGCGILNIAVRTFRRPGISSSDWLSLSTARTCIPSKALIKDEQRKVGEVEGDQDFRSAHRPVYGVIMQVIKEIIELAQTADMGMADAVEMTGLFDVMIEGLTAFSALGTDGAREANQAFVAMTTWALVLLNLDAKREVFHRRLQDEASSIRFVLENPLQWFNELEPQSSAFPWMLAANLFGSDENLGFLSDKDLRNMLDQSKTLLNSSVSELAPAHTFALAARGMGNLCLSDLNKQVLLKFKDFIPHLLSGLLHESHVRADKYPSHQHKDAFKCDFASCILQVALSEPSLLRDNAAARNKLIEMVRDRTVGDSSGRVHDLVLAACHLLWPTAGAMERDRSLTPHVFMSYTWEAHEIVRKIGRQLQLRNYVVWNNVEVSIDDKVTGVDAASDAVAGADVMICAVSQSYKTSVDCRLHCHYATEAQKRRNFKIIPIMLEKGYRGDGWLTLVLAGLMFIKMTQDAIDDDEKFEHKIETICHEVGQTCKFAGTRSCIQEFQAKLVHTKLRGLQSPSSKQLSRVKAEALLSWIFTPEAERVLRFLPEKERAFVEVIVHSEAGVGLLDVPHAKGRTAVLRALCERRFELVKAMLKLGADPTVKDAEGRGFESLVRNMDCSFGTELMQLYEQARSEYGCFLIPTKDGERYLRYLFDEDMLIHKSKTCAVCRVVSHEVASHGSKVDSRQVIKFIDNEDQFKAEIQGRHKADTTLARNSVAKVLHSCILDRQDLIRQADVCSRRNPKATIIKNFGCYVLVMERGERDLSDMISHNLAGDDQLSQAGRSRVVRLGHRIATCLFELETSELCHGDVKPRNMMEFLHPLRVMFSSVEAWLQDIGFKSLVSKLRKEFASVGLDSIDSVQGMTLDQARRAQEIVRASHNARTQDRRKMEDRIKGQFMEQERAIQRYTAALQQLKQKQIDREQEDEQPRSIFYSLSTGLERCSSQSRTTSAAQHATQDASSEDDYMYAIHTDSEDASSEDDIYAEGEEGKENGKSVLTDTNGDIFGELSKSTSLDPEIMPQASDPSTATGATKFTAAVFTRAVAGKLQDKFKAAHDMQIQKLATRLKKVDLFRQLAELELQRIATEVVENKQMYRKSYKPKQAIVEEGEVGNCMIYVERGTAHVEVNGNTVYTYTEGGVFGEVALTQPNARRTATVRAGPEGTDCLELGHKLLKLLRLDEGVLEVRQAEYRRALRRSLATRLKKVDLFRQLAELELQRIVTEVVENKQMYCKSYKPKQAIVEEGEEADCMIYVERGTAHVEVNGNTVYTYTEGGVFGEVALTQKDARRTATVRAGPEGTDCLELGCELFKLMSLDQEALEERQAEYRLRGFLQLVMYSEGDDVEVYSYSSRTWCEGNIATSESQDESVTMLTVDYRTASGIMRKTIRLPEQSDDLKLTEKGLETTLTRLHNFGEKDDARFNKLLGDIDTKHRSIMTIIDLDSSAPYGKLCGMKGSSAYSPPELAALMCEYSDIEDVSALQDGAEDIEQQSNANKRDAWAEYLEQQPEAKKVVAGVAFDAWSFGMVLYCLTGPGSVMPFHISNADNIVRPEELRRLAYEWEEHKLEEVSKLVWPMAQDLVLWCLQTAKSRRPQSFRDVLNHPFFDGTADPRYLDGIEDDLSSATQRNAGKLHAAIQKGDVDTVRRLFETGSVHYNLLGQAAGIGDAERPYLPLQRAAYHGHKQIVQILLNEINDLWPPDVKSRILDSRTAPLGYTAFMLASECEHSDIAQMLESKGCNTGLRNELGKTGAGLAAIAKLEHTRAEITPFKHGAAMHCHCETITQYLELRKQAQNEHVAAGLQIWHSKQLVGHFGLEQMEQLTLSIRSQIKHMHDVAYHFTDLDSARQITHSLGIRASREGQLGGGVSVWFVQLFRDLSTDAELRSKWRHANSTETLAGFGWKDGKDGVSFAEAIGKALWGSKWYEVIQIAEKPADAHPDFGRLAKKLECVFMLSVPTAERRDPARVLPGRQHVYIIPQGDCIPGKLHNEGDCNVYLSNTHVLALLLLKQPAQLDPSASQVQVASKRDMNGGVIDMVVNCVEEYPQSSADVLDYSSGFPPKVLRCMATIPKLLGQRQLDHSLYQMLAAEQHDKQVWSENISRFTVEEMTAALSGIEQELIRSHALAFFFTTNEQAEALHVNGGITVQCAGDSTYSITLCLVGADKLGWRPGATGNFKREVAELLRIEEDNVQTMIVLSLPAHRLRAIGSDKPTLTISEQIGQLELLSIDGEQEQVVLANAHVQKMYQLESADLVEARQLRAKAYSSV